ncbi:MAG: RnfABCDGE type electron transport complex subunit D, partial [Verrucomicrobia bacterium]|nr:RnfABCDGE type electron transport complex subunit D [Verrucomicrobiota bacterium]
MHPLLKAILKSRPKFEEGGPLRKLWPVYEAGETFLFTPDTVTPGAPHVRDPMDIKRYMITVLYALIPCILFGIYNAGFQANHAIAGSAVGFWRHMGEGA